MLNQEQELVRRCLAGEESAYREFVERFQSMIYGVSLRMLQDRHDAEDVAQEVFLRAIRNLKSWDGKRPLRPWLLTIAANRCRTHLSRRRLRTRSSEHTADFPDPHIPETDGGELRQEIEQGLLGLREDYRRVFMLYHEQGLNYEEMSEVTGRPVGTLKTWLHRARAALMAHLREKGLAPEVIHDELSEV